MMVFTLMDLPVEMRLYLYRHLSQSLKNISLCCKQCYYEAKPLLWRYVCVPHIYYTDFLDIPDLRENLYRFTDTIWFSSTFSKGLELYYDRDYFKKVIKPILRMCNPEKLIRLSVERHFSSEDIRWTFDNLKNLKELTLSWCSDIVDPSAWTYISGSKHLKKLKLNNCHLNKHDFKNIVRHDYLDELHISSSERIGCSIALEDVFSLSNVKKLTIIVPGLTEYFPLTRYATYELRNLVKLSYLNLSYCPINNDWMNMFVDYAENLQVIICCGCEFLRDDILKRLCLLSSLNYLDVRLTKLSVSALMDFSKRTGMREISHFVYSKSRIDKISVI